MFPNPRPATRILSSKSRVPFFRIQIFSTNLSHLFPILISTPKQQDRKLTSLSSRTTSHGVCLLSADRKEFSLSVYIRDGDFCIRCTSSEPGCSNSYNFCCYYHISFSLFNIWPHFLQTVSKKSSFTFCQSAAQFAAGFSRIFGFFAVLRFVDDLETVCILF